MLSGPAALSYSVCQQVLVVASSRLCCEVHFSMNVGLATDFTIPPCMFSHNDFLGLLYIAACQPGSIMHMAAVCSFLLARSLGIPKTSKL